MVAGTQKKQRADSVIVTRRGGTASADADGDTQSGLRPLPAWVEARPKATFPKSPSPRHASSSDLSPADAPAAVSLDRLLTVREVAALFQVSEKTIRRLIAVGDLPVVRLGRSVRIHTEVIEKIMRQNE